MRIPVVCILGHNRCTIQNNTIVYSNFHFYILQCYIYIVFWVTVLDGSFSLGNCHNLQKIWVSSSQFRLNNGHMLSNFGLKIGIGLPSGLKVFQKKILVTLSLNTYILINVGC